MLAVVDGFPRENLALVADTWIPGLRGTRELDNLVRLHGKPEIIVSDNDTELTSTAILGWSERN